MLERFGGKYIYILINKKKVAEFKAVTYRKITFKTYIK